MSDQDYELGYYNGRETEKEYWQERLEVMQLQLEDMRKRYDYLLELRTKELLIQPMQPILIEKPMWLDSKKDKG